MCWVHMMAIGGMCAPAQSMGTGGSLQSHLQMFLCECQSREPLQILVSPGFPSSPR